MEILAPGMGQAATFRWGSIHPVFLAQEQQSHWGRGNPGAQEVAGVDRWPCPHHGSQVHGTGCSD